MATTSWSGWVAVAGEYDLYDHMRCWIIRGMGRSVLGDGKFGPATATPDPTLNLFEDPPIRVQLFYALHFARA